MNPGPSRTVGTGPIFPWRRGTESGIVAPEAGRKSSVQAQVAAVFWGTQDFRAHIQHRIVGCVRRRLRLEAIFGREKGGGWG
jgi:hypothetical protein